MIFTLGDLLKHHGVKGQKWGVRRTSEEFGHKPPIKEVLEKSRARSTMNADGFDIHTELFEKAEE